MWAISDMLFAPLYLLQARKLKQDTVRLPEAEGERGGVVTLNPSSKKPNLSLMMVGDSSACGVGVTHQDEALIGQVLVNLQTDAGLSQQFAGIDWQLHATTGHTSFDVLRRLYVLPKPSDPIDVMVIVVGVNDVTISIPMDVWQNNLSKILAIAHRKFGVKHLFLTALPPMALFPALPKPLNAFVGKKSDVYDDALQTFCQNNDVYYVSADFLTHAESLRQPIADGFASDGFHPNATAYALWGKHLAHIIATTLSLDNEL